MSGELNRHLDLLNTHLFEVFNLFGINSEDLDNENFSTGNSNFVIEIKDFLKEEIFLDNYEKDIRTPIYIKAVVYTLKEYIGHYKGSAREKHRLDYSVLMQQLYRKINLMKQQVARVTPYYIND